MFPRVTSQLAIVLGLLALPCQAATTTLPSEIKSADLRLIDAIKARDRNAIASLLVAHVDVNAAQPDGATPLSWAAYLDQAEVVDTLLKAGANPASADEYGDTALTLASANGNFAVMEKLVAAGADASAARWNGETALMLAARSGTVPGIMLLLAHGAKIDLAESRKGQNALMWAAAEGHSDAVDILIASGSDVKAVSKGGFNALVFAAQKGDARTVNSLLNAGLNPDYTLPNGTGVLHVAASGGNPKLVQALIEHKASVNAADKAGNTALHLAAQSGEIETVKLLLANSANPNLATAEIPPPAGNGFKSFRAPVGRQTPLLLAARANHEDVMRALIAAGADPKMKAQDGGTVLMAAAGSGHLATVKYAYELDPDVNAVTSNKRTVMHAAVIGTLQVSTQPEICDVIRFLAEKGADLDPEDAGGRTPITIANVLPIDQAVTLMTKLIVDSGKTPKKPAKR